nr:hypothetical protein BaRGS_018546 [Batillaria attramentaria]
MDGQRICRVCADKAVAHNFDVITCESCKTFFRRNAHKPQETLLQMPTTPEALRLRLEDMDLDDTLGYCEHFATDFVNFIKRLPDFRALDMNDQMAAVKGNGMRCLLLKGAACFSEERDAWLKDFGEVPVAAFMRVTQHEDVVGRYADFSRTLKRILKNDYTGFVLLNLILLFEPQAARLFDRQTVNMLHDKYAILLKHHLESQYSYLFASQYQDAIWDCVNDSKVLAADMISMFNKWKDIVGPLMAEVINLQ